VQNGVREDAVLSLYDATAGETIREDYVQATHTVRMKGIPEGIYQLAYMAVIDWMMAKLVSVVIPTTLSVSGTLPSPKR
jgi:hypothetical protein